MTHQSTRTDAPINFSKNLTIQNLSYITLKHNSRYETKKGRVDAAQFGEERFFLSVRLKRTTSPLY